ncbi:MAG TPA: hypothetical protein PLP88_01280 [Bacteroidales bacterium]|nr:hypothetical protein [Bacteroidales bacterium]
MDPRLPHPGLADRLKVTTCIYYIAKINGFNFRLIFDDNFNLPDFLSENEVHWIADKEELSYSLRNTRLLAYNGSGKIPKLNRRVKQYHIYFYIGKNILLSNNIPNYEKVWTSCYRELFKPSPFLQQMIEVQGLVENSYIAVHLRFVNALEQFEQGFFNTLDDKKKQNLIYRCVNALDDLRKKNSSCPIVVFSDSITFLKHAKIHNYLVLDGKIGHLSHSAGDKDAMLKTFIDYYMISRARSIYMITAPEMYLSVFSTYAALTGGKEIKVIQV